MRSGVLAQKIGMTRVFAEDGRHLPVTVLRMESCQVVGRREAERDGYTAVQLGVGAAKAKNTPKAQRGQFAKAKVEPKRLVREFRVPEEALLDVGATLAPSHFVAGQIVDVAGTSKGKGFAGAIKRWNFGGMRASHGVSISHRAHGSTGQNQDPGKVFKGKKMAGHMGDVRVTAQNLEIVQVDDTRGLILVKGAVPGPKGGWVEVRDAVKKVRPEGAPYPAGLASEPEPEPVVEVPAGAEGSVEADASTEAPAEVAADAPSDTPEVESGPKEDDADNGSGEDKS